MTLVLPREFNSMFLGSFPRSFCWMLLDPVPRELNWILLGPLSRVFGWMWRSPIHRTFCCQVLIPEYFACLCRPARLFRWMDLGTLSWAFCSMSLALRWRHNERDGVSNHQPHDCLLNRLFRRRSKKTSKLRVTGLCVGNSPATGEFPHKGLITRKMLPFDDVIVNMKSTTEGLFASWENKCKMANKKYIHIQSSSHKTISHIGYGICGY